MVATFELRAIAQISAAWIVGCLSEGTLIAVFAGFMLKLSRRQSSASRFAMWFSALMTIAALPLFSRVGWSQAWTIPGAVRPIITLPGTWALYLFGAWTVIATWCLSRVGVGLWHLHTLRKSCVPIDAVQLDARLRETLERNRGVRPCLLCTSERVQIPTVIGLLKPFVVIPVWVIEQLSLDEVNQILLHELAHLSRWDDWTNLLQKVVKALFFFHPAVWWIEKRISLEREMACDDAVLAQTARPRAYAECLAHLAEKTLVRRSLALAQAAIGRLRQTSLRVAQILDADRLRIPKRGWRRSPLIAGFAIACGLLASKEPCLIAFQGVRRDAATPMVASSSGAIRPLPAAFETAATFTTRSGPPTRPHRVVLANNVVTKNKEKTVIAAPREFENFQSVFMVNSALPAPSTVRLIDSDAASPLSTEAVFVVIQSREQGAYGSPVYEIQVFRFTVLRRSVHPVSNEFSSKKI